MPGPLEGVKVVELGVWVAAPAAAGILADWGADVIKIEPLAGDPARSFQRMLGADMATNPIFENDNRGKRSIALDLATEAGQTIADHLLAEADVMVTNVRLSGLERLGLDPDSVTGRHPHLIYAAITGYGLEGPDAERAAYDVAGFWSRAGIASLLVQPGEDPPFQRGGMGDHCVGITGAAMVCAALFARERTGTGQVVSTSLLRQGAYTISFDLSLTLGWGLTLRVGDRASVGNPAMNNYLAGDGRRFWIVGLEGSRHWPPLARVVGHEEWLADPRFATPAARSENAVELIGLLDAIFLTRTLAEWEADFAAEPDLFWAPVQTPEELLADPQFRAAGGFVEVPDGSTTTTMLASPADFGGTPWSPTGIAPRLGEHGPEILRELGRGDEIESLTATGVLGSAQAN